MKEKKKFPKILKPDSGPNLKSLSSVSAKLGEVEIVQPKPCIWQTYDATDGLPGGVNKLLQDQQGNLWLATVGGWPILGTGLVRYDGAEFITYTTADGLADNLVSALCEDRHGRLWLGTRRGLSIFDGERFVSITEFSADAAIETLARCWISAICEDRHGRLWVGTGSEWVPSGHGVICFDGEDFQVYTTTDGLVNDDILSICEDHHGRLWVGCGGGWFFGGVSVFDGEQFVPFTGDEAWMNRSIRAIYEDRRGRIWLSGWASSGRLSCYDNGKFVTYTVTDGSPDDSIGSIVEDDSGNLWVGTTHGLYRFNQKQFIRYDKYKEPTGAFHQWSAKDAAGQLWFGTLRGGLYRYDGKHFQQLTTEDGLPNNSVTGLIPQPDGSMIISTFRGIVHYRPTATIPPRVEIREVIADQVYRSPTELELTTAGTDLLLISYRGLSFSTRRMRYSCILEGHDKVWRETWDETVRYENLPPGDYTFKVIAINRDLVESEAPATLKLTVLPDPRDLKIATMQTEIEHLRREVSGKYDFENIIGRSDAIKKVRRLMELAIDSGLDVLITGETGTGKELVAKGIHYNSLRKDKIPLDFNCGAMPKELIASKLFGHRKGAFTDAREEQEGLFEAAEGSTVILDEIGEMPLNVQVHLLRVLDQRQVQRIGEHQSREVDVRIIAMTNRILATEMERGHFREDLYYRLNEFPISVPPLRERREDIPLLAEHFLREIDKQIDGFAPEVFEMLQSYHWPGNVRELQKAIQLAAAFVEEGKRIETYHFPVHISLVRNPHTPA